MSYILMDTGPLVAYFDKNDQWHSLVAKQLNNITSSLNTCEAVITEVVFLMLRNNQSPEVLFDFITSGALVVHSVFSREKNQSRIREIIKTYNNLPASFADACLVNMYENEHQAQVFTLNSDFTIYRTKSDKSLSLIISDI